MHFETYSALQAAMSLAPEQLGAFRFLPSYGPATLTCSQCCTTIELPCSGEGGGTGYAVTRDDKAICYPCAGENERRDLLAEGKGYLYLTRDDKGWKLTNWSGDFTIRLHAPPRKGAHNLARVRYDVWFGFGGADWHGVQIGDNTQVCRVKHLKRPVR